MATGVRSGQPGLGVGFVGWLALGRAAVRRQESAPQAFLTS